MARQRGKPAATQERTLEPAPRHCWECGRPMWMAYHSRRRLVTLKGILYLTLPVRKCRNGACTAYQRVVRPWEEGALALPQAECGLDLVAFVGACRYQEHRSVPEIHRLLKERQVPVCERTVTNLLSRYEELVALRLADPSRLHALLKRQGKVILTFDGMQPDVGHEVLWTFRDLLSGEVLLARSLLSATAPGTHACVGDRGPVSRDPRCLAGSPCGGSYGWANQPEASRRRGSTRRAAPVMPVPLPAGSGQTHL